MTFCPSPLRFFHVPNLEPGPGFADPVTCVPFPFPEPENMALAPLKSVSERRVGLSHLLGLLRPEVGALVVGSTFVLVSIAADLAYPQVIRIIIDGTVKVGQVDHLAFPTLVGLVPRLYEVQEERVFLDGVDRQLQHV